MSARGVRALALSGGGAALVLAAGALTLAPACGGESATLGIEQPIRVYACDARSVTTGPQFREGTLPDGAGAPNVIGVDISDRYLLQGQRGKKFSGSADPTARAVAIRLADVGTGYWVVPTRLVDPQTGNFTWEACVDFSREVAPGPHKLQLAAIDANGNFGKTFDDVELMVKSLVPTGKVVVSLRWDSDADLDLEVETPSGKTVDPKHPSTADKTDAGVDPTTPGAGKIDRDSNAACVLDGYRQEDLVFQGAPTAGTWLFRVNMFAACGAPAANFTLSVYVDGVLERTVPGRLVDTDANGGDGPGLFVTQLQF